MPTQRQYLASIYRVSPYKCRVCGDTEHQYQSQGNLCKDCAMRNWRKWRIEHPYRYRRVSFKARLRSRNGITAHTWMEIWRRQNGGCYACGVKHGFKLHIDHDHACCPGTKSCGKCIRGLLCARHNHGLGMFQDNVTEMRKMIEYLEYWSDK